MKAISLTSFLVLLSSCGARPASMQPAASVDRSETLPGPDRGAAAPIADPIATPPDPTPDPMPTPDPTTDPTRAAFVVHEWGTFTSVVAATGQMLAGLEIEEAGVPAFVGSFPGFAPRTKGLLLPVRGATVKMETPVLYFYSPIARRVQVGVGFEGGTISQWYPERSAGEPAPTPPALDLTRGYRGRAEWRVDVLAPDAPERISARPEWETPQWPRARVAGANLVRGPQKEIEGFIFYRCDCISAWPLAATCAADGTILLRNTGADAMPFVWVYENPRRPGEPTHGWFGSLAGGATQTVAASRQDAGTNFEPLHAALERAGLTRGEAGALIATWRESYFEHPGLRVFWIVPRAFTDAILPLTITPKPDALVRVLVGRTEILTPAFESELRRDFARDRGQRWQADRYFFAYRERARQLEATVAVAPAAPGQ